MFGSKVRKTDLSRHSNYNTQTLNLNFRFKIDDKQNFYFKAITNWLNTESADQTDPSRSLLPTTGRQAGTNDLYARHL